MTIGRIPSVEGGIQPTIVDAKGDILTATAADTPAVLAVGNNGETLVADSSATTGLRWQGNFAAGKNAILNGDFTINQRAFTSVTANGTYTFDRFVTNNSGGTVTFTPQTFTPGSAPVAGYEATNFLQIVTSGQSSTNYAGIGQKIENVRTFAGQTATLSFWAKATSGTPKIGWYAVQNFGSGGSATAAAYAGYTNNLSTSWARYSITYSVPSVSGKSIGTSSAFENYLMVSDGAGTQGIQNNTFQIWGVQLEPGSVATGFETATGTLAGELAACQRYYEKSYSIGTAVGTVTTLGAYSGTRASGGWNTPTVFKVSKRSAPTVTVYSIATGTSARIRNRDAGTDEVATVSDIGENGSNATTGTGGTSGVLYGWQWEASAEL